ncbi:MAG: asparagine synthase (glutamine-hydrolyzing) [Pseudodesulfovibrio sp.]|nr:asparagine synthase (glutamine-hydrolyzing) [Pseudodesulfovibrio sp.]
MCGICGFVGYHRALDDASLKAMTDTIDHRGPDDSDIWLDREAGVGLGHRRLSILDLSPLGRQPMHSACGRYVIAYNGEVYNHLDLRRELGEYPFKSTSDTETILAAISQWGLEEAVKRFVGMFAFALWDRQERSLSLVRDRLGIKPLYYGLSGGAVVFGSELKALRAAPVFDNRINRNALGLYFRHSCIPTPYSIYEGIHKLTPGTIACYKDGQTEPELITYWSSRQAWLDGIANPFGGTIDEATDELDGLLRNAVGMRMLSDVPLGAFLSGGIDSSTIVAMMQEQSSRPVKTFAIGFHEDAYSEAKYAKEVARHLGTDHTELYLSPKDLLDVIPLIPKHWDEPFADASQIPTYCVSRLAREYVTVSLSGDGGDELFAGYRRYFYMNKWSIVERVPYAARYFASKTLAHIPAPFFELFGPWGPKVRWRVDALSMKTFSEFYRNLFSHCKHPEEFVLGSSEPETQLMNPANRVSEDRLKLMTLWDTVGYLPDDILTKVDRASMAVGLETRVPLLDHRVVEFAAALPTSMKVQNGSGKEVLRRVLDRYVPRELVDRPKMGFGVPIQDWLRNELRDWCESLLQPDEIRRQGLLNADMVERMWREYLDGTLHWNSHLWDVLMFQAWLAEVES